ncbi:DUF6500 family protein [Rugamonas apoptosis]|uniref:Msl2237 protein n=1 Tax=Rugamonas apoptosis TaxID=2758570 RepID=A0A7W2FCI7_9BURK|nr:DUF6500 family protein [Rugamonas apoptosis]MBA5689230.1 hypothetical protein [Rugamonas apoptosis]
MRDALRKKVIAVCDEKIAKKGPGVGLSFYAFFANKNDNPELLMEAAEWWIREHELDHFEKATKIKEMVQQADRNRAAADH